ncbi:cytochrome P450 [Aspergillus cavernicola]|uniref:Cytochrome P450 n=1 Tax=Aspergillus cavernicola TaxID=176166 RepID=A0ABR4HCN8_9EURO
MPAPTVTAALCAIVLGLVYQLWRTWRQLHDIPGPFWAKVTNFQRLYWVRTMKAHEIHQRLHSQYGDVVRMGPNMVSIADPAAIPTLYTPRAGFPKSKFYRAFIPYTKGGSLPAIFTAQDEALHKQLKSPIANLYSLTNVVTLEPFVNLALQMLKNGLDKRFVDADKEFDLGDWLQYFAFETMGTMTFSRQYGLLRTGDDCNGMMRAIWEFMLRIAPMTQIPWLDHLWYKNQIAASFQKPAASPILKIISEAITERQQIRGDHAEGEKERSTHKDFLDQFLDLQESMGSTVQPWFIRAWTFSNVIAGSDSTASIMKAVMYYLLANPESLSRLQEEVLEREGGITRPFPLWEEVKALPFLDACVNEAIRLHPPFCLPLERVAPKGGVALCGRYFVEGTIIGMNPYICNRHPDVFGEDADVWRPERWIVADAGERRKMEGALLTFGAGRRICMGKSVALLEIKKVVPALLLNYNIIMPDPGTYTVENSYFFRQKGIMVRITRRD